MQNSSRQCARARCPLPVSVTETIFGSAWLRIHQHPLEVAAEHVRNDIQAYANHLGSAEFYHETMTVASVRLIASHDEQSFDEFLRLNAHRLNKELYTSFLVAGVAGE